MKKTFSESGKWFSLHQSRDTKHTLLWISRVNFRAEKAVTIFWCSPLNTIMFFPFNWWTDFFQISILLVQKLQWNNNSLKTRNIFSYATTNTCSQENRISITIFFSLSIFFFSHTKLFILLGLWKWKSYCNLHLYFFHSWHHRIWEVVLGIVII